ncbi:hypothetical protein [Mesoterricola silvestris]|uniref:Uncharacterized protein n=1 Tax=Mesoterricola silvestris TaxID=2927979 RepID=A0AA48KAP0_9BACT|nr:hypothetical protein [Mesoterricola silvestris]BDU73507.1 hypothetical protein METEAL_26810 [Mesoterricola silvestris]
MRNHLFHLAAPLALAAAPLGAWSPAFHEVQTARAAKLLPKRMAAFLATHSRDLATGARGQANDQVPTVEDVEEQFRRVVVFTEERKRPERIARELGVLAHQVQLLLDPSAVVGVSSLRESFQAYGDEKLAKLVLSREPFWAVTAPLDPRPRLVQWAQTKFDRNQALQPFFDEATGRRKGGWDELSVPFAQLQLSFSNGINATANIWIQLWRAVGDQWDAPGDESIARD